MSVDDTDAQETGRASRSDDANSGGEGAEPNGGLLADLGARGLGAALKPLSGLATVGDDIREMTEMVGRMAGNTENLDEVTATLKAIRERTEHMDREVAEMHAAVEELKEMMRPVSGQLESVTRLTNRLPGGRKHRRAQAEADAAASAEEAALEEEVARARDAE